MKLFLWRTNDDRIHGVDYDKGLKEEETCGRNHEFHTRDCKPIYLTEEEAKTWPQDEIVEIVPFRVPNEDSSNY